MTDRVKRFRAGTAFERLERVMFEVFDDQRRAALRKLDFALQGDGEEIRAVRCSIRAYLSKPVP